jgi:hypothetical protein
MKPIGSSKIESKALLSSPLPTMYTHKFRHNSRRLSIKALTWLRDSHGLFDYESFQLTKNTLRAENCCVIARCGTEVRVISETEAEQVEDPSCGEKFDKLAAIKYENGIVTTADAWLGKYFIESCSNKSIYDAQLDKLWLIVRAQPTMSLKRIPHDPSNNNQEIYLHRGDVIKLGRIAFRVKDYRVEGIHEVAEGHEEVAPYQDSHMDLQASKCIPA